MLALSIQTTGSVLTRTFPNDLFRIHDSHGVFNYGSGTFTRDARLIRHPNEPEEILDSYRVGAGLSVLDIIGLVGIVGFAHSDRLDIHQVHEHVSIPSIAVCHRQHSCPLEQTCNYRLEVAFR